MKQKPELKSKAKRIPAVPSRPVVNLQFIRWKPPELGKGDDVLEGRILGVYHLQKFFRSWF